MVLMRARSGKFVMVEFSYPQGSDYYPDGRVRIFSGKLKNLSNIPISVTGRWR